jgi:hypothetical protein
MPFALSVHVNDVPSIVPEASKYVVSLSEAENFFTNTFVLAAVPGSRSAVGMPVVLDIVGKADVSVETSVIAHDES